MSITDINISNNISETYNRIGIQNLFSIKLLIGITIFYIPIVILDIYYALCDDSCVNQYMDASFTLYTYLLIDAIYGVLLVIFLPIIIFIIDLDDEHERQSFCLLSIYRTLVIFAWTVIGSYMFWGLMDNTKCEKSIYYYMFVSLIIRYIIGVLFIGLCFQML